MSVPSIRLIVAMRHQLRSQKKGEKKEGNEATSANSSLLFFRNVSCGEHFQRRFLAMREIKAADEL